MIWLTLLGTQSQNKDSVINGCYDNGGHDGYNYDHLKQDN